MRLLFAASAFSLALFARSTGSSLALDAQQKNAIFCLSESKNSFQKVTLQQLVLGNIISRYWTRAREKCDKEGILSRL